MILLYLTPPPKPGFNYSKGLSNEVSPKGVRVLTVSHGWIITTAANRMIEGIAESSNTTVDTARQSMIDDHWGIPFGMSAWPEKVAELVGYLVSPLAPYLTGTEYVID